MATPDISTKPEPSTKCRRKQRASPFVGLFLISAFVLSSSMVPYFALRRRFMRSEENLKNFLSVARREQLLALSQNHAQLNKSLETMRMQLDKAMGDLKDVRTAMLKDRNTANALEKHADGMRYIFLWLMSSLFSRFRSECNSKYMKRKSYRCSLLERTEQVKRTVPLMSLE